MKFKLAAAVLLLTLATPSFARFLQTDPVGYKDDNNLYSYVGDDPMNHADPTGLCSVTGGFAQAMHCLVGLFKGSQGAPPTTSTDTATSSKDKLVQAQDSARANPSFQPGVGGSTHCNQSLCYIASAVGAPKSDFVDSKGNPLKANQIADNLATSKDYKEVTKQEAQTLANGGTLVVGTYKSDSGSGHVATVRPQGVAGDSPPASSKGPLINNVGTTVGVTGENYSFGKVDVHYYAPNE